MTEQGRPRGEQREETLCRLSAQGQSLAVPGGAEGGSRQGSVSVMRLVLYPGHSDLRLAPGKGGRENYEKCPYSHNSVVSVHTSWAGWRWRFCNKQCTS